MVCISSSKTFANDKPILVTVRKQAEPAARVPGVVHVLNKNLIKKANVKSPTDISALVPGFSFNDPFGRFNPAPSLRGLIQPGLGDDPSVGFFTDGLYLSGRSSINAMAFDTENIEVAKGPQNALYGRNSFGGAINVVSTKPTDRLEYWFDGRAGTHDRYDVQTGINLPLSKTVKARLALYKHDWGGYFKNALSNGPEIGRERTEAARLSMAFDPNPDRNVIWRITQVEDDDTQPNGFLITANCGPRTSDSQLRLYCGTLPGRANSYAANNVGTEQPMGYRRSHTRTSVEWTEHLSPRTTVTTLAGGALESSIFIRDDDYQAANAARAGIDTDRSDLQFDSRINHRTADGKWQGLTGFSLYRFINHVDRIDQLYVLGQTAPNGPKVKNTTDTAGIYGSLTRNFAHGFALTGDGRWQWEGKTLRSTTNAISTGQPINLDDSWTAFTPKLTGSWTANNGLLLYTSAAKGYKTGGFNDRANILDNERAYQPEENITYEAGVKNIPLHRTLNADLGAFLIDWSNQQVTAYSTAAAAQNFFINNAGQTTVKGIEATVRWRPTPKLSASLGYTYADARYDSYKDPDLANIAGFTPTGDVSGNRLPRYSPHHAVLAGEYRTPSFIPNWNFVTSTQFTYQSSQFTDNSNTSKVGDRTLLNLQTGFEKGNTTISFFADNVLNEKDPNVAIPWTDATQSFRREWLVVPQDGPVVGVRVKVAW